MPSSRLPRVLARSAGLFLFTLTPAVAQEALSLPGNVPFTSHVYCDFGHGVNWAIAHAPDSRPLVVVIHGVCNENVTIDRSRVTLRGIDPSQSGIRGVEETDPITDSPITIRGGFDVAVENLTVSNGGSSGIAMRSADARIENCVIESNANSDIGAGVFVGASASVRLLGVTVQNNVNGGVWIDRGGFAAVVDSLIQGNHGFGIRVSTGASARVGIDLAGALGPSTIINNVEDGIALLRSGSALVQGNTVMGNGRFGVLVSQGSSVSLTGNVISGNGGSEVLASDTATARLEGNTVTDDSSTSIAGTPLTVARGSTAHLVGGNTLLQQNAATTAIAITVAFNSALRQDTGSGDTVSGPQAVSVFDLSHADLRQDFTLNGSVEISHLSKFRVQGSGTIDGDVHVNSSSAIAQRIGTGVTITGTCSGSGACIGF